MKISQYASFYQQLGKIEGIASVSDDKLKSSLLDIVSNLTNLFSILTTDQATPLPPTPQKPHSATVLGGVVRPKAEKLNQTPQEKAEEEAFAEVFEK